MWGGMKTFKETVSNSGKQYNTLEQDVFYVVKFVFIYLITICFLPPTICEGCRLEFNINVWMKKERKYALQVYLTDLL